MAGTAVAQIEARPPRPEKVAAVEEIKRQLLESEAVLLTEYRGMTVKALQRLRRDLRAVDAEYKVVKCTLARLAATEVGFGDLIPQLEGPIAFVFVKGDAAAAAKALMGVAGDIEALVVKGGMLGESAISSDDTKALAELPSREVLLSQIAGAFKAPMQKTANLFAAPIQGFANLLDALSSKRSEAGDE